MATWLCFFLFLLDDISLGGWVLFGVSKYVLLQNGKEVFSREVFLSTGGEMVCL